MPRKYTKKKTKVKRGGTLTNEEKGFTIKNIEENKFMFIECIKN